MAARLSPRFRHGIHDLRELSAAAAPDPARVRALVDHPPRSEEVRRWWADLDRSSRERLSEQAPLLVGNLDGVPWPERIRANHRTLAADIAQRRAAGRGRVSAHGPGPVFSAHTKAQYPVPGPRAKLLEERLESLAAGPGFIDRGGRARFLLAYDPRRASIVEYIGHAIAETDDPWAPPLADSVRAVGIFVPGNDSDLLQFEGKSHISSELVLLHPHGTTGMIAWQGGRFPSGPLGLSSRMARQLAPRLGRFVNGMPRGPEVRHVAFGFSFGGAVTGLAMRLGMRVDAVAHVSSAGLGAGIRSLEDLPGSARVPHYALMAPGDLSVGPILGLDVPLGPLSLGHGANPLQTPGIVRLETGWLQHVPEGGDLSAGRSAGLLRGHSTTIELWGTTAKHNLAAVLAGGRAELAAPRSPVEQLAERAALPWSPLERPGYLPRYIDIPGPLRAPRGGAEGARAPGEDAEPSGAAGEEPDAAAESADPARRGPDRLLARAG